MIAEISTIMKTTPELLWKEITRPQSLQYVAAPILYFTPKEDTEFHENWEINKEYNLKLFLFKVLPLGSHKIVLRKIDPSAKKIISKESGALAKVWNHTITFHAINSGQIKYTDIIEIKAGLLTPLIWLFSHIFYRHRQRRWKRLLAKKI